jgi:hypothetical protein
MNYPTRYQRINADGSVCPLSKDEFLSELAGMTQLVGESYVKREFDAPRQVIVQTIIHTKVRK